MAIQYTVALRCPSPCNDADLQRATTALLSVGCYESRDPFLTREPHLTTMYFKYDSEMPRLQLRNELAPIVANLYDGIDITIFIGSEEQHPVV